LFKHEFDQSGDLKTSSQNTSDGGESGIVPSFDFISVDEPLELSLGQAGSDEVESGEFVDGDRSQVGHLDNPVVLLNSIGIFVGSHGVSDSFNRIDDGASKIVSGVNLVLGSGSVMGFILASVKDGISHALVEGFHIGLTTDTVFGGFTDLHLFPDSKILFGSVVSGGRRNTLVSVVLHDISRSVVAVALSFLDEVSHHVEEGIEVVRGVGKLSIIDTQSLQIFEDRLNEFVLFLGGVGIIETDNHLAFVDSGIMVVNHGSLDVTDVEITRGFRRETSDDFALFGTLEDVLVFSVLLLKISFIKSSNTRSGFSHCR
jgi:hypothetical protein